MFSRIRPVGLPQCDSPTPHAHTNTSQYIFRIYRISRDMNIMNGESIKKSAVGDNRQPINIFTTVNRKH